MFTALYEYASSVYNKVNQLVNYYAGYDQAFLERGSLSYLKYLIKFHRVNKDYNKEGLNALHVATITPVELEERLALLLDYGVNVNSQEPEFSNTPLHLLIANENITGAKFLIDDACKKNILLDFSICDKNGCTPLLLAAKARQEEIALHILQQKTAHNAIVDLRLKDKQGYTALDYAVILGQRALAKQLLSLGAPTVRVANNGTNVQDFGEAAIRDILTNVAVDPDRDENAPLNHLHDSNRQGLILLFQLFAINPNSIGEITGLNPEPGPMPIPQRIQARKNAGNDKFINEKLMQQDFADSKELLYSKTLGSMSQEEKQFIQRQYQAFSGKSLVTKCLEEQARLQQELRQHPYGSTSTNLSRGACNMKVVIIPLGTIVKTDFNIAVGGFVKAAGLTPEQIKPILGKLMPLFPQFNLGKLSKEDFKSEFFKILPLKDPDQFEAIWNSMCVINEATRKMAGLVAHHLDNQDQVLLVIYSDTNPIQFGFIEDQLKDNGLLFDKMYISYKHGMLKDALLKKIMADFKDNQFVVVLGNSDKITDEQLKAMVQQKDQTVLDAAKDLQVVRLPGPQLTEEDLTKLLSKELSVEVEQEKPVESTNNSSEPAKILRFSKDKLPEAKEVEEEVSKPKDKLTATSFKS